MSMFYIAATMLTSNQDKSWELLDFGGNMLFTCSADLYSHYSHRLFRTPWTDTVFDSLRVYAIWNRDVMLKGGVLLASVVAMATEAVDACALKDTK
ncbi:hypothetical protein PsYK624_136930 [Phanerochaete sordida]|uniref:Uncharacterized protein n=1 Tax=Phanerochaete sordida TaxID=48140 RepID=A0A9P3GLE5_9APHY|nr:hypothetical protein PsYK624_136930 [Phanerochaete sordida]